MLRINDTLVEPGQTVVTVFGGLIRLSMAPEPNGGYPLNASVGMIAEPTLSGFPFTWGGVDRQDEFFAAVEMNADRFVVLLIMAPTPTPIPVITVVENITKDTTWKSSSQYVVTADLQVAVGSVLTIEPGTTVKFTDARLLVYGALKAVGTPQEPIVFTSDTRWEGIRFLNPTKNSVIISGVIEKVTGTALDIEGGFLSVSGSVVRLSNQGIWVRSDTSSIVANEIYSNQIGVLTGEVNSVTLLRNTIRNNDVGIMVAGPSGRLTFNQNNINDNLEANLAVTGVGNRTVDASQNWWGTTDKTVVERTIRHQTSDGSLALVVYEPIATEKISEAP